MRGERYEVGLVGLGVMGRNLLLNIAGHGHAAAGCDRDGGKVRALRAEGRGGKVAAAGSCRELLALLERPRAIIMLVPAGRPVDEVVGELLPHLERDDVLVDAGNSHFRDTEARARRAAARGVRYLGVGVSGGEEGARRGPSIMAGGDREAYARVGPLFEAIAARAGDEPCAALLGPGSAGHYVKMVHNGIEYGLLQLLAESYDLMKRGLGMDDDGLAAVHAGWNRTELESYLVGITAEIFARTDRRTGRRLVDEILDEAAQKGTGKWASQDAMELGVPTPTIDAAVAARSLSALKEERVGAARVLDGPPHRFAGDRDDFLGGLRDALFAATVATYAQGFAQLRAASRAHGYGLSLETVAAVWRAGCIVRAAVLGPIREAFRDGPELPNLLLDPRLALEVRSRQGALRSTVTAAVRLGLPAPALAASLAWFDGYRSEWLPANLIQAQRDYFGAHTYERVDERGSFHTDWGRP